MRRFMGHPYTQAVVVVLVLMILIFLAIKAGLSLWIMSKLNFTERFGAARGSPDFWEIGSDLAAYRRRNSPGYTPDNQGKVRANTSENFRSSHPMSIAEDSMLSSLMYGTSRRDLLKSDTVKAKEDKLLTNNMWAGREHLASESIAKKIEDSEMAGMAWAF